MDQTLKTLKNKTTLKNAKRLAPASADMNARHRPLEIVLSLIFDKRTALAKAHLLERSRVFVQKNFFLQ